jgi:hypothetical protein
MLPRVALSTAIHIVAAVTGIGLIWLLMNGNNSLAASVVERLIDNPISLQSIREEAVGHIWLWCGLSVLIGYLLSSIWIVLAERVMPHDHSGARSQTGSWAALFVATVIGFAVVGYIQVVGSGLTRFLTAHSVAIGGLASLLITCFAFYLGTLFGVKRTMRASVPFAPSI